MTHINRSESAVNIWQFRIIDKIGVGIEVGNCIVSCSLASIDNPLSYLVVCWIPRLDAANEVKRHPAHVFILCQYFHMIFGVFILETIVAVVRLIHAIANKPQKIPLMKE